MVKKRTFPNLGKVIQEVVKDSLDRMKRGRLARECIKLDQQFEETLAEEGIDRELKTWPEF